MEFKDHFSVQAEHYARCRPGYPRALFEFLATLPAQTRRAWDCGTGGGQAAVALADFFDAVVASDPSEPQIVHAARHPRVDYVVATAERPPLADSSVDLVTVAQALHWFQVDAFFAQVRRVARPGGVLAAWGYDMASITPPVDELVQHLYAGVLGSYWPPERRIVEAHFAPIAFPFRDFEVPPLEMAAEWNLQQLVGYLETWSSVQQYRARLGTDPVAAIHDRLAAAWGPPETVRSVRWPLFVRAGLVE